MTQTATVPRGQLVYGPVEKRPTTRWAGLLYLHVCCPAEWDNIQVLSFAERDNPCGTTNGWVIFDGPDESMIERQPEVWSKWQQNAPCCDIEGYKHVLLVC